MFDKGRDEAALSAFEGRQATGVTLATWLLDSGIDRVDVCGIATDYCVRATVLDACQLGFHVRVLVDLTAGVAAGHDREGAPGDGRCGRPARRRRHPPGTVAGMLAEQLAFDDR